MGTSSVRVLVVDDFEPFRRFILSTLQDRPELQVICEVSDGLEAIAQAEKLQPDLILLDIGLPKLNGIEAGRQISKVAPQSKILFLSQESSADVVREALGSGGQGYVLKAQAQKDLLTAVEAVLQGKQFVSNALAGRLSSCHAVQFFSDDALLLDGFTRFIAGSLKAGGAAVFIATEAHRDSICRRLQAHGLDVRAARERGSFVSLDVADVLSTFMVGGLPEPSRFFEVASGLVSATTKTVKGEHSRVVACGECAPVLLAQGKADAAIRLEQLWDGLARTHDMDILCGYAMRCFRGEEGRHILRKIRAEHSAVHPQQVLEVR